MNLVDGAGVSRRGVEAAMLKACRLDVIAFKPGNVSLWSPGHGMQATDFLRSAKVAVPALCNPGRGVGERIEDAVEATYAAVKCNTNLGIILLLAPLAVAVNCGDQPSLRERLHGVLAGLTVADSAACYRAIRRARPAGLGRVDAQDVNVAPSVKLRDAMQLAAAHDSIAAQYSNDFELIFSSGVPALYKYRRRWRSLTWATSACYLEILAANTDSHVARKAGQATANDLSAQARRVVKTLKACENPRLLVTPLTAFDHELKTRGVNPGTTADLTVASLAVLLLKERFQII